MALLEPLAGSRERAGFRPERQKRAALEYQEKDFRPNIGAPMTAADYEDTVQHFNTVGAEAQQYETESLGTIEQQRQDLLQGVQGISYSLSPYSPPTVERVPIHVTRYTPERTDYYGNDRVTPARYEDGGTYYFDPATAESIVGQWTNSRFVTPEHTEDGFNLMIYDTHKGEAVADVYVTSLQQAQQQFDAQLSAAQQAYDEQYRAARQAAQQQVEMQRQGATENIEAQAQAARENVQREVESLLAGVEAERQSIVDAWGERRAVNADVVAALLQSGILTKRGTVK